MQLHNIKHPQEAVTFCEATLRSIGKDSGLFFPKNFSALANIAELLELNFAQRSARIMDALIGDEFDAGAIKNIVEAAFDFPAPLKPINDGVSTLELFHGPTLAFKDFGARFMAGVMAHLVQRGDHQGPLTILSATSGDTGAAVAHAFYGVPNIQVVVLYPHGRISTLQEKLFCTLGGNIHTVAVDADFDTCQALVKQCFNDLTLVKSLGLNSANSINIARLLAQTSYYFELAASAKKPELVVSVPSGNFGNLTAGLIAQQLGAPIKAFIAATNSNDTVPRYLASGTWQARDTISTESNAMDVSSPNNWPRIEQLFAQLKLPITDQLRYAAISERNTVSCLKALHQQGYVSEPHGAVAYAALQQHLKSGEYGVFLGTAHPAKFIESVERHLNIDMPLPAALAKVKDAKILSHQMEPDFALFKHFLMEQLSH